MRRKLAIDPRQIEHRCNRTDLVIVRYHLFKAERIKQLSLVLLQPTHHGPFPPLTASTSGNHCSRKPSTDFCNKIGPQADSVLADSGSFPTDPLCVQLAREFRVKLLPECVLDEDLGLMAVSSIIYNPGSVMPDQRFASGTPA